MLSMISLLGIIAAILVIAISLFPSLLNRFRSSDNSEQDIVKFVRTKIIPSFHRQRQNGEQFAVLLVTRSTTSIRNTKFKPSKGFWGEPLTDSNQSTFPPRARISNYVVARPADGHHAERLLLDNLNTVLTLDDPPPIILFYTWTMPCTGCTMAIARALGNRRNVILVYTANKKEINTDENAKNRNKLVESGIQVIQAEYEEGLPALDLQSGWISLFPCHAVGYLK